MSQLQALRELRRRGYKPAVAFVDVDCPEPQLPSWSRWENNHPDHAQVDLGGKNLARIDWRPFVGMNVILCGQPSERLEQAKAALGIAARLIVASETGHG